jgi:hypothetical protein
MSNELTSTPKTDTAGLSATFDAAPTLSLQEIEGALAIARRQRGQDVGAALVAVFGAALRSLTSAAAMVRGGHGPVGALATRRVG